jgi:fatty-acyl-CoA synthase
MHEADIYATTVDRELARSVALYPERVAVSVQTGQNMLHVTYQELAERIAALAGGLRDLGIRKGEILAILLPNCIEYVYSFFAPGYIGAVIAPLSPTLRQRELQLILAETEAVAVILIPQVGHYDLLGAVQGMRPYLPCLRHVIVAGAAAPAGTISFADLVVYPRPQAPGQETAPDDLFALLYTAGTTGTPKAVMHTHGSTMGPTIMARNGSQEMVQGPAMQQVLAKYGARLMYWRDKPQVQLSPSPLFYMAGYQTLLSNLSSGGRSIIPERFHPVTVLELVANERPQMLIGSPTMYAAMLAVENFDAYDKSTLMMCIVSTAPATPELVQKIEERFGAPVVIPYGATEVGGGVSTTRLGDAGHIAQASIGRPYSGVQVKVVDEDRRPVPLGGTGELATRVPGVMKGYFKAPEMTAAVLDDDGWYYTGDMVVIDEQGNIKIVGRKKDMIIRGGQNIYPLEVEMHLQTHPAVEQAAVVGVPDEMAGERVWAFVVPRPGLQITPKEVRAYCLDQLAPHKVPEVVRIVDSLPMTAFGKVKKFELRAHALEELRA